MKSIPVLYYHRVGSPDPISLSVPTDLFRRQMEYLHRRGYRTLTMQEFRRHLEGQAVIAERAVVITFDDGFRDNYLHAFPVLKRLQLKAGIFVCTSLIRPNQQPGTELRPFNEAHLAARRGDLGDFLSEAEITEMKESGCIELHSHSHAHQQTFYRQEITGVFPTTDSHWGIVSAYGNPLSEGVWPVFKRQSGFLGPALTPDVSGIRSWMEALRVGSGKDGWNLDSLKKETAALARFLKQETADEFRQRIKADLETSYHRCRPWHDGETHALVWPWGSTGELSDQVARESGYNLAFLTATGANLPGTDCMHACRFPVKKPDMFRFALGVWLRESPLLARAYGFFRGRI